VARVGDPVEIAMAVAFPASPQANYIQGALLDIDGGRREPSDVDLHSKRGLAYIEQNSYTQNSRANRVSVNFIGADAPFLSGEFQR
jgi:hypothetical protein